MKERIGQLLTQAITSLQESNKLPKTLSFQIKIDTARNPEHGDYASNIAMILAKQASMPPRELADLIVKNINHSDDIENINIAGPGFINFKINKNALAAIIPTILSEGKTFGHCDLGKNQNIHLEIVSANPTGPLHVGHGRGAAYGSCVANLLSSIGYKVHREYYINDAGRQMHILATSIWLRYLELSDIHITFPCNGYRGEYIKTIAQSIKDEYGDKFIASADAVFKNAPEDAKFDSNEKLISGDKEKHIDALIENARLLLGDNYTIIFQKGVSSILADIRDDLSEFGVVYDEWFSEQQLMDSGSIQHCIDFLNEKKLLYKKEGALWFRTTDYGDDKDRVVIRANGQTTYFASDIAYHLNKIERNHDLIINILGADHHGYVVRLKAAMAAMSGRADSLVTPLVQFVSLYRGNKKVQMSTRSGSFVTLRELRNEVGNDATRFFYVMRKIEQPLDFDMELAKSHSNENPVYYIQYAHARICSVWRQLEKSQWSYNQADGLDQLNQLTTEHEHALITKLQQYRECIIKAAEQYEPHLLTNYLYECATLFHTYYNANKFLIDDHALRNARLCLIESVQQILQNGLQLLGISTPETM